MPPVCSGMQIPPPSLAVCQTGHVSHDLLLQIELPSSQNIMNLDLGSKIDLQVYASSYGSHYSHSLNLVVELSNPLMLHKDTQASRRRQLHR